MKPNVLTIAIPTYNRVRFLKQTLDILLPQLIAGVEIVVYDNCSPDETPEYIKSLRGVVKHVRHSENIGSERNFLACVTQSETEYVWLLGDDDLPASNVIAQIMGGIGEFPDSTLFYLRAQGMEKSLSAYTSEPVDSEWRKVNADDFLTDVSFWFTFMSSLVVKRKHLNLAFLDAQKDNNLVSGAIALSLVGEHNGCILSTKPLIYARPDNTGGYNGLIVFCQNVHRLLNACSSSWFSRSVIRYTYDANLANIVSFIVASWKIDIKGLISLIRYSYSYESFHKIVVPILLRRLANSVSQRLYRRPNSLVASVKVRLKRRIYHTIQNIQENEAPKAFREKVLNVDENCLVRHPFYLHNPQYIQIGKNFYAAPGLRIEAWDSYMNESYEPNIVIGNNVCMNFAVHIGAIERVEIGNYALIGSNVLITDHAHGDALDLQSATPFINRPLTSKGPTIIEENVWIGEGVCILSGVTIGHGAIIGANSVVTHDVAPGQVVGGVPARPLRLRTTEQLDKKFDDATTISHSITTRD